MSHIEEMLSEGQQRFAFEHGTLEFDAEVVKLEAQFGPVDTSVWRSISTAQRNSIHDDNVVSIVFRALPFYLDHYNPAAAGRKYFLEKGWVYDKVYYMTTEETCTLPRPEGSTPMFIGVLVNVFGQPGDEDLTHFKCLYFMAPDHDVVEAWAGQTLTKGAYSTFYSATYDDRTNEILRIKSYAYEDQGAFSDWDVVYMYHRQRTETPQTGA